jgi:hypothetical protein
VSELDDICHRLRNFIAERRLVPFLGAGASMAGRAAADGEAPGGEELRTWLVATWRYPEDRWNNTLPRVAQFVHFTAGNDDLRRGLRGRFVPLREPGTVHDCLAEEAARAHAAGDPALWPVVVTTNYDDLLETAFERAGVPYDLVTYAVDGKHPGFRRRSGAGALVAVRKGDDSFAPEERTVILKLHGSIDRDDERADSFVITEDHYIDYLAGRGFDRLPTSVLTRLRNAHFLFLGYGLEDWTVRVILHRLWDRRAADARSLAIQLKPTELDRDFWLERGVKIVEARLEDWVDAMERGRT